MVGLSSIHTGEEDKPNEDAFLIMQGLGFAAVADGVTRSRLPDGSYPWKTATLAPRLLLGDLERTVQDFTILNDPLLFLQSGFREGNQLIWSANECLGVNASLDFDKVDYLATVANAFWMPSGSSEALVATIGDTVVLWLPNAGSPELLSRDGLAACHRFSYRFFQSLAVSEGIPPDEARRRRLVWQRSIARNHSDAQSPEGEWVGFGVLTGEPEALEFLETRKVDISGGGKVILASDALRACADERLGEETIHAYAAFLRAVGGVSFGDIPAAAIACIREKEIQRSLRSDDATVVVVEIF